MCMTDTKTALKVLFGNNTTKAAILETLIEKPLTQKELHNRVQKNGQNSITYQATHKATQEMITDQILSKQDKLLKINKEWIHKLEGFTQTLKDKPTDPEQTSVYEYDSFGKFVSAIIKFVHDAPNPEKLPGVCITKNAWPPIGLSKEDYELLNELLKETKYYDISTKNTPLGKAFAKTLEKMGKEVKVGSKLSTHLDFICKGNDIFEVAFDDELQKELNRIFTQHKTLDENAINDILQNIITKPSRIKIIHTTSPTYANELRKKILKEFKVK